MRAAQSRHGAALIVPDLEGEEALRPQQGRRATEDRPIGGKPVRPSVERGSRVEIANFSRQSGDVSAPHVRRVRYDDIEGPLRSRSEIAAIETDSIGDAEPFRIEPRRFDRRF